VAPPPSALRRACHGSEPAPGPPRPRESARRTPPPRDPLHSQESQGPHRTREARRSRDATGACHRHRRVRRARQ